MDQGRAGSNLPSFHGRGRVACTDLYCSSSSDVLGVDCSREGEGAPYLEDRFPRISTVCLYLEDAWRTQSWLQHSWRQTCHLSAMRFRSEDHHWPISYTGWPISPGVQSLFLSSTIWNRLWCRGKSTSLRASWCLVSSSLSFPTQAEQKRKITVS